MWRPFITTAMPVILTTPEEVDLWVEGVTPVRKRAMCASSDRQVRRHAWLRHVRSTGMALLSRLISAHRFLTA
jgi:hypothetical protein